MRSSRLPGVGRALLVALVLFACAEADDLGDEPPDGTVIRSLSITWVDGIGNIFATKCGTCHSGEPDPSVPQDVPGDLDLTKYRGDGVTFRGAVDILPFIRAGLLDHDLAQPPVRRMPLPFATPLTEHETRNLVLWTEAGGPSGVAAAGCVVPADDAERATLENRGQQLFTSAAAGVTPCLTCHPVSHYSRLDCRLLEPKVSFMYDLVAGNGQGAWSLVDPADQDALLFYVATE